MNVSQVEKNREYQARSRQKRKMAQTEIQMKLEATLEENNRLKVRMFETGVT